MYNKRFQFIYCWVFIVWEVEIHQKCSKCLPPKSVHAYTRRIIQ